MRFKILEQAELELDDAYDYYEYELEGLGRKFLEEFMGELNVSSIILVLGVLYEMMFENAY